MYCALLKKPVPLLRGRVSSLVLDRIIEYNHGHYYALAVTERSSLEGGALEQSRKDSEAGGVLRSLFHSTIYTLPFPTPLGGKMACRYNSKRPRPLIREGANRWPLKNHCSRS